MAEYIKCETCLYNKNCQFLAKHRNTIVEDCSAYKNAADVVEVVRCKDCVNYCGFEHCKNGVCDRDSVSKRAVYPDDFCSYGERK